MKKNVIVTGLLCGILLFIWMIVTNAILPFRSNMIMKSFPEQKEIHALLKDKINEAGIYNIPYGREEMFSDFPNYGDEPIFQIVYTGTTHSTAGSSLPIQVLLVFAVPLLAVWVLSESSDKILSSFMLRFLYVFVIGVLIAVFNYLTMVFYPTPLIIYTFVHTILTWILAGLFIALRIKPNKS
ncbi:MAG: hypothetical protein GY863_06505 [bacterium]|nr:hypothetical protein [bacterium]